MLTVAYLANQFPSPVEPYVADEIGELRKRGVRVISGSVVEVGSQGCAATPDVVLRPIGILTVLRALCLCVENARCIAALLWRIFFLGVEGPILRLKALAHTLLGACFAVRLQDSLVDHIHVHHGFSASWIGMVAAKLLGIEFSMTLHGSDLLIFQTYLDVKLESCAFCLTVSEYNRHFLLSNYPKIGPEKISVVRLGVDSPLSFDSHSADPGDHGHVFRILAVGRLNAVKDHAFLIRACADLRRCDIRFECEIAGEGPERGHLESMIRGLGLREQVRLFGHADRDQLDLLYAKASLVVLTSRSEGIPLVLMEAMARGKLVLAPAITGIPELVIHGQTGFLYQPGSIKDFLDRFTRIRTSSLARSVERACAPSADDVFSIDQLRWVRHAARVFVQHNFNRQKNLKAFGDLLMQRIATRIEEIPHESAVLQQI